MYTTYLSTIKELINELRFLENKCSSSLLEDSENSISNLATYIETIADSLDKDLVQIEQCHSNMDTEARYWR